LPRWTSTTSLFRASAVCDRQANTDEDVATMMLRVSAALMGVLGLMGEDLLER
jgi:hypothetical protein